ncbi:Hypothetical protein A7982_03806 [Minicystis rosea]|nr:Hypothetical protein A7982_03806 [Minicystis rosea]
MSNDTTETKGAERAVLGLFALASLGVIASLWIVDYLPTHDGPQHVFLGHLSNHFDDPGAGYAAWLERGHPRTALGFNVLFAAFEKFAGWRTALKLTLTLTALAWGFGHVALSRALHPQRAALGLVGFATAISWSMYMGFFSFTLSVAVGLTTLAVAAGAWPWTPKRRLAVAALLSVQAVAHIFAAELTGLVLLLMVALAPRPPEVAPERAAPARAKELGLLALMGLPALIIAAGAANPESRASEWLSLADRFTVLPRMLLPGPLFRAWPPLLLGLAGLAVVAARVRRAASSHVELAVAGASLLFLACAFFAPLHLAAWEFFAPRFLPFACLLGAALIPLERLDAARRRAVIAGLAGLAAMSLVWAARTAVALRARVDDALSGLSAPLDRKGPRLVVPMDPFAGLAVRGDEAHAEIPYYAPLFNLGALYAVAQGGVPSYTFVTNPQLHSFVFSAAGKERYPELYDPADLRDPRVASDPAVRAALMTFLAAVGTPFADVVVHGRPEDGDLLADRGYVTDYRRGGLFIGRFEGCPVTIEVVTPSPRPAAVFVEYGIDPLPRAIDHTVLPPEPTASGEHAVGKLVPRAPLCGPSWLRATLDVDRSGGPSKGDRFCDGADAKGRVHLLPKRGQTITCRIDR